MFHYQFQHCHVSQYPRYHPIDSKLVSKNMGLELYTWNCGSLVTSMLICRPGSHGFDFASLPCWPSLNSVPGKTSWESKGSCCDINHYIHLVPFFFFKLKKWVRIPLPSILNTQKESFTCLFAIYPVGLKHRRGLLTLPWDSKARSHG